MRVGPTTSIRPAAGYGERGKRCPSGAFAEGESDPNESSEASSGQQRKQCPLRRLSLRTAQASAYAAADPTLRPTRPRRACTAPSPAGSYPAPARGGRDGDGSGAFGAGHATAGGGHQFGAKRLYAEEPINKLSGRREAERERRPADGVGYRQGWARQLTIPERPGGARTAPSPAGPCPAQGAGRVLTGRTDTGGGHFGAKRHSCHDTPQPVFRPQRFSGGRRTCQ